jgi:hypothetical protein
MKYITILLTALLVACGGGGSSSESASPTVAAVSLSEMCEGRAIGKGDRRTAPTRVVIAAGQSNMWGHGQVEKLNYSTQLNNVIVRVGAHWETYKPKVCFGPEFEFLKRWSADHPNETIGLIKFAIRGSSMNDWTPNYDPSVSLHGPLYERLIDVWTDAGSLPVELVLWMQGESDAIVESRALVYASHTDAFITELRNDTNFAPFVFGQTQRPDAPYISYVNDKQEMMETNSATDFTCMARTGDLHLYDDNLHIRTSGHLILGDRMYDRWLLCQ